MVRKALIVEDDPDTAALLADYLRSMQFQPVIENGYAAITRDWKAGDRVDVVRFARRWARPAGPPVGLLRRSTRRPFSAVRSDQLPYRHRARSWTLLGPGLLVVVGASRGLVVELDVRAARSLFVATTKGSMASVDKVTSHQSARRILI